MPSYTSDVEEAFVLVSGSCFRGLLLSQDANDRFGSADRSSTLMTHKLPEDDCCTSGSEVLSPTLQGLSYSCPFRQHIHSLVYKISGVCGYTLLQTGTPDPPLGSGKARAVSLRAVYVPG